MDLILTVPVEFLAEIDLFAALLEQFVPAFDKQLCGKKTIGELIPKEKEAEFMEALSAVLEQFHQETAREIREFGVEADPADPRFDWGTPEKNEAAVRCIEQRYPVNHGDIICYGPSNMTLWYSLEQDMLPWHAQNHGMGGCTDVDLIAYAPRVLYPYRPSAVIMQTGSNDLASGIPLEEILRRKEEMYSLFHKELPETKFIVCSGLPLPGRMQYWEATARTNAMLKDLCDRTGYLYFMDATDAMLSTAGEEKYQTADGRYFNPDLYRMDKIHLNKKGHDVWTALMKQALAQLI